MVIISYCTTAVFFSRIFKITINYHTVLNAINKVNHCRVSDKAKCTYSAE